MTESLLQVVQEVLKVKGLLAAVYEDLARPGVKQVGEALDTVLGLGNTILLPLKMANEKSRAIFVRNMERYRVEMEKVPESRVISATPEISAPIVDKLTYVADNQLATLYSKLLASASDNDKVQYAHPSFVHIINSLSPDEANFLSHFTGDLSTIHMVSVKAMIEETHQYMKVGSPLIQARFTENLLFPENMGIYISNLDGLGIISRFNENPLSNHHPYEEIEGAHRDNHAKRILEKFPGRKVVYQRGAIEISPLGRNFLKACLHE